MKRFRFGIRCRMLAGLLLIFAASAGLLAALLGHRMDVQLSDQIRQDTMRIWQDTNLYARQLLIAEKYNNDSGGFENISSGLSGMLEKEDMYTICSVEGTVLAGKKPGEDAAAFSPEDRQRLEDRKTSLKINYLENDGCMARALLPVIVDGKTVGAVRIETDYTEKRRSSMELLKLVMRWILLALLAALAMSFILMGRVIRPVLQLSALSGRISQLVGEGQMDALPSPDGKLLARRDETGELAGNFDRMIGTISGQFTQSRKDQKRILDLMQARQTFFDHATHELKTPLTTIKGYAQLISEDGGQDQELFETGMAHILSESERLHNMVIELLELSDRRETESRIRLDLSALAEEVAGAMQLKANRYGNALHFSGKGDCTMTGQSGRLKQLIINLTDNAVKYGYENRPILIRTEGRGDSVLLYVINYGPEIPEADAGKIFEPFYRTDKERSREMGSSGLGLSICRRIAEDHGGRIDVRSRDGKTVFRVELSRGSGEEGDSAV